MKTRAAKRIKKSLFCCVMLFVFLLIAQASAYAGTVRGMLFRVDGYGQSYPAAYVPVSLNHPVLQRSGFAYSGTDGMYYLYNVPPGEYSLEIWVTPNQPMLFTIYVQDTAYTDIAPIRVP